jgi:hypothetical protein
MHKIEFVMIVEHKASTLHFFFFFLPRGRTVLLIILDQFFFCLSKKTYSVLLFTGSIKSSPYTPYSV